MNKELIDELKSLPKDYWNFKDADTKEYTHGIHNYPAVMVSPISRNILRIMSKYQNTQTLFDPFAGSGTVLVEGMLAGIPNVIGNDINPLALLIEKGKTTLVSPSLLENEYNILTTSLSVFFNTYNPKVVEDYFTDTLELDLTSKDDYGSKASKYLIEYCRENDIDISVPNFKNIGYWFKPQVIIALEVIKEEIMKIKKPDVKNYFLIAFSETVRLVSNRRNGEFKMFRMTPEKVKKFNPDVFAMFKDILWKNIQKMKDFNDAVTKGKTKVKIIENNACELSDVEDNSCDLIITSPPYGDSRTTVAYGEYSKVSLQWLDLEDVTSEDISGLDKSLMGGKKYKKGFDSKIKSNTLNESLEKIKSIDIERAGDVYSFYEELEKSIKAIAQKTKRFGYQFWVVGNRVVKGELLKTDQIISEIAKEYGLETQIIIDRNIPNKVMPSINSPTNKSGKTSQTMTMEHIIVMQKVV